MRQNMALRVSSGEEVKHESCSKNRKFCVKKRESVHAIEEFAAQQLVFLPILSSPTPLTAGTINRKFFLVRVVFFLVSF